MVKTKHFTITGEFITRQARDFWTEGKESKAIQFLVDSLPGLTPQQATMICTGIAKLTGDSKSGVNLEDDATTEHRSMRLQSIAEALANKDKERLDWENRARDLLSDGVGMGSPWGYIRVPPRIRRMLINREIDWDNPLFDEYHDYVATTPPPAKPPTSTLSSLYAKVAESLDRIEPAPQKPPEQDREFASRNGWIDRRGRFFPCSYGGHIELADLLGESEHKFEQDGWIKISDSQDPMCIIPAREDIIVSPDFKGATQSQIDAVFAWCQKHGRKFPIHLQEDQ